MTAPKPALDDIFLEAAELPEGDSRRHFLDQVCGDDGDLRARVEELLAAIPRIGSLLDVPPFQPTIFPTKTQSPAHSELVSQTIGPYKLLQNLGAGGMGVVYLAEQDQPVRRQVAIKVIREGLDTVQITNRFEQERVALALMDHPNIARVLDAGTTDNGRPYFAMELVKGMPITAYCDQEHLSIPERIRLFIPVCRAIQHAHQKGIIHRDLKPSNVIVGLYDGQPIPKVIDFGVAKAVGQRLIERTMFTEVGQIVGTMEYMAPEQAELNNLDVDTRTDIYALGALLYELLTGSTPFTAQQLRSAGLTEMLRVIRESDPVRPSTRVSTIAEMSRLAANRRIDPTKLASTIRGELDWITLKCLEKDRGRRYESAVGLASDLERYLADEPVLACPPSRAYRFRKAVRRHRVPLMVSSAIAVLLVAASAVSSWQAVVATQARRAANSNLDLAISAVDQFLTKIADDPRLKERDLRPLRSDLLNSAVGFHERLLELRGKSEMARIDLARSYARLAGLTADIEASDRAIEFYQLAKAEYGSLLQDRPSDLLFTIELCELTNQLALLLTKVGRTALAEETLIPSIRLLRKMVDEDPSNTRARVELAKALSRRGYLLFVTRKFEEAKMNQRDAIHHYGWLYTHHPDNISHASELAHSHSQLANAIMGPGLSGWREAEQILESGLSIAREAANHPNSSEYERLILGRALIQRAHIAKITGRRDETLRSLQEAAGILEGLVQEAPSVLAHVESLARTYFEIANCDHADRDLESASASYHKAKVLLEDVGARDPENSLYASNLARVLNRLADLDIAAGRVDEALAQYNRCIELSDRVLEREPREHEASSVFAESLIDRARLLARIGKMDAAVADCDRFQLMLPNTELNFMRMDVCRLLVRCRDHKRAADATRQALADLRRTCDPQGMGTFYVEAARIACQCAELVRSDLAGSGGDATEKHHEFALECLRKAKELDFADLESTCSADEFVCLRHLAEFAKMLEPKNE